MTLGNKDTIHIQLSKLNMGALESLIFTTTCDENITESDVVKGTKNPTTCCWETI